MKLFLALLLLGLSALLLHAQRQAQDLNADWKFLKQDAAPDASTAGWESVHVPHTWNALDGQDGKKAEPQYKDGYYRGPGWYEKTFDAPPDWLGRRVFIRFEAAALVADVYLNGAPLGQHRGGFAAFTFELTPQLKVGASNELRVKVDNSHFPDVPPISGDFTVFGGLYRPVQLIITDPVSVTVQDFGGPGVYLTAKEITPQDAQVEVESKIENGLTTDAGVTVTTEIDDASGKSVATQDQAATIPAGQVESVKQTLTLGSPHLWNGRKDPYLYTARVRVTRNGRVVDEVTQPLGLRTAAVDPERGFLLNGEPYPLHGVNRHQEKRDKGWALSPQDEKDDIDMILDIGATCLRLAHYQQSEHIHQLCDEGGLVVWQEIPFVNEPAISDAFNDNARQQLTEEIRQGHNNPSLCFWSLFNEVNNSPKFPRAQPLLQILQPLAHELDPTRPTAGATCMPKDATLNSIPDVLGFNLYPGWYFADEMGKSIDERIAQNGDRVAAVTEYGAGGNPFQHQEGMPEMQKQSTGSFHPEEYQDLVHEADWKTLKNRQKIWGTFLWAMFDFASDGRDEGSNPGVNDKGLVTEDRQIKKDVFFFYRANWNPDPLVYIASRRMTPRKLATTEVKVYSNCDEVELLVNGESIGQAKPDEIKICRWPNVTLSPGLNKIEAVGTSGGGQIRDQCKWTLEPQ